MRLLYLLIEKKMNIIIQPTAPQNELLKNEQGLSKSASKVTLPNQADINMLAALYEELNNPARDVLQNNIMRSEVDKNIPQNNIILRNLKNTSIAQDFTQDFPREITNISNNTAAQNELTQPILAQSTPIQPAPTSEKKPLGRDSSLLFVIDNRIIPEQVGFRDKVNANIWLHPRDIADPAREQNLRAKLEPLTSMPYPSYHDGDVRKPFTAAIRRILQKDPTLNDDQPKNPFAPTISTSSFNAPLAHIVNGQPFPELLTEAEQGVYRDANAIFLLLEYKLASKNKADENVGGYPDLLQDTMEKLANRGITQPSIDQLIHELHDALGVTTTQFVRTAADGGVLGVAELLKIDPNLVNEVVALMDYSKNQSFPLNDVLNWEYGRKITAPNSDIAHIIDAGQQERITQMIAAYKTKLEDLGAVPSQINSEMLLASATDLAPPLLRELFFQIGGQFVMTQEQDLYNVINQPATGFNLSYQSKNDVNQSLNQIFISGDLGLPRTNRTIVHEMHHMLFPENISPNEAIYADNLLNRDEVRLNIFKELAKKYSIAQVAGDVAAQQEVLNAFDSPQYAINGVRFSEMLDGVPIPVFLGAVNEAFQYLQIESPSYNRIGAYQDSDARWREIPARFAEIKFVEYVDRPQIIDFIVPNITKMYDEIYMPHLQRRLDYIYANQPSKADAVINANIANLENNFNLPDATKLDIAPWNEKIDENITVLHPAGDVRPVSFVGLGTTHPSVQNYQAGDEPMQQINPQNATVQPMAEKMIATMRS